jgi:Fe-S cluster assembly protein SufD
MLEVKENKKEFIYLLDGENADLEVTLQDNSYLEVFFIYAGQKVNANIDLQGENCSVNIAGVYSLKDKQTADINININHNKPNCDSSINLRGIATDESRANITMKSYVAEGAIKTEAKQLHRSIVLSDNAKIVAKPELEIYNDDVQCAHGNTVGNLDKQAMFYLQSRGINEKLAREMLIDGFLDEAVKSVSKNEIKEQVFDTINKGKAQ